MTSTPMAVPTRKKGRYLWLGLLILVVLIAAAAAFFIFYHPSKDLPPIVQIDSPSSGNLAEINVPLQIQAEGSDFPGVKRIELYADGALIGSESSDLANGGNPLLTIQTWTPLSLGRHALVARGYDSGGKFSDSNVVYVDVVNLTSATTTVNVDNLTNGGLPPSLNQIAAASGATIDDLHGLNPSLGGGNPDTPLPPGTDVTVPRTPAPAPSPSGTGSGSPPLPLPGSPAAPTNLTGNLSCTSAQISWTASSDAVDGYAVYRIGPAERATSARRGGLGVGRLISQRQFPCPVRTATRWLHCVADRKA